MANTPTESPKKPSHRPTLCTEETTDEIARLLRDEYTIEAACNHVGITSRSYHNWMDRGVKEYNRLVSLYENGDLTDEEIQADPHTIREWPYFAFFQSCARARADCERAIMERIEIKSNDKKEVDYKADTWKAEKMFLHLRGSLKVEHSGAVSGASMEQQKKAGLLSDKDLARNIEEKLKR